MPDQKLKYTIEADDKSSSEAHSRFQTGMRAIEKTAKDVADAVREHYGSMTAAAAALAGATGKLVATYAAHRSAVNSVSDAYRALRLYLSPTLWTATSLAIGAAVVETTKLAYATGKVVDQYALAAAKSKISIGDAQRLGLTSRAAGFDPTFFRAGVDALSARMNESSASSANKAILALGLDTKKDASSWPELLGEIGKAMDEVRDPVERARLAIDLFGTDVGEKILPRLNGSISENIATYEKWGAILSRSDSQELSTFRRSLDSVSQFFHDINVEADAATKSVANFLAAGTAKGWNNIIAAFRIANAFRLAPATPGAAQTLDDHNGSRIDGTGIALLETNRNYFDTQSRFFQSREGIEQRLSQQRQRRDEAAALLNSGVVTENGKDRFASQAEQLTAGSVFASASQAAASLQRQLDGFDILKRQAEAVRKSEEELLQARTQAVGPIGAAFADLKKRALELSSFVDNNGKLQRYALSGQTVSNLNAAFQTRAANGLQSASTGVLTNITAQSDRSREFQTAQFRQDQEFQQKTLELNTDTLDKEFSYNQDLITQTRDAQLRSAELVDARTLSEKLALTQRRLAIELDYLQKQGEQEAAEIEHRKDREIAYLEFLKIIRPEAEQQIQDRIDAVVMAAGQEGNRVNKQFEDEIAAEREKATISSMQLIRDKEKENFDTVKRSADQLFDAMLGGAKSFADALRRVMIAGLLTPVKEAFSNTIASIFVGPQGRGSASGGGGILGGLLGLGAQVGLSGAPGGTSGFSGPVSFGGASTPGIIGGSTLGIGGGGLGTIAQGGLLAKLGLGGLGTGSAAGLLGIGGAALGLTGAFKLGQTGSTAGKIGAPILGAASGLLGFGSLAALFPSLIAAGPAGWIAAAGIGATIGLIGAFKSSAEQKIVEKVKSYYGIDIPKSLAHDPLLGLIKQGFGGNIDLGLQSPQIRDLIELYAMSTGQGIGSKFPVQLRPLSFSQTGSVITQAPSYLNGTPTLATRPVLTTAQPQVVIQSVQLVVDKQGAGAFMDGRITPVAVSNATAKARSQSIGNRDAAAAQYGVVLA